MSEKIIANSAQLTLYMRDITHMKKRAKEAYERENNGPANDDVGDPHNFDFIFDDGDCGYENGRLRISGSMDMDKSSIGYIYMDLVLPHDLVTKIIEDYVKRINKVKAVLEAMPAD